jgi:hypothetical protein
MTPMQRDSRKGVGEEGFEWGADTIEAEIRERVRGMIEVIIEEKLESALGAANRCTILFDSASLVLARLGKRLTIIECDSLGKTRSDKRQGVEAARHERFSQLAVTLMIH